MLTQKTLKSRVTGIVISHRFILKKLKNSIFKGMLQGDSTFDFCNNSTS